RCQIRHRVPHRIGVEEPRESEHRGDEPTRPRPVLGRAHAPAPVMRNGHGTSSTAPAINAAKRTHGAARRVSTQLAANHSHGASTAIHIITMYMNSGTRKTVRGSSPVPPRNQPTLYSR